MRTRIIGYYRPFPWARIGANRTGRTTVERELRGFCREHDLEWVGFHVETDRHVRWSFEDRIVGQQVMGRLRLGLADEILVSRLEHVFSSAGGAAASLERWLDQGIGFRCLRASDHGALHIHPDIGTAPVEGLIHALAGLQRNVDFEHTRERVMHRKTRGAWTGRVPYGFFVQNGRLIEEPQRVERIQRMKTLHRRGRSYRQIAREFGLSVGAIHRLVKTDLRTLRRMGRDLGAVWPDDEDSGEGLDKS